MLFYLLCTAGQNPAGMEQPCAAWMPSSANFTPSHYRAWASYVAAMAFHPLPRSGAAACPARVQRKRVPRVQRFDSGSTSQLTSQLLTESVLVTRSCEHNESCRLTAVRTPPPTTRVSALPARTPRTRRGPPGCAACAADEMGPLMSGRSRHGAGGGGGGGPPPCKTKY